VRLAVISPFVDRRHGTERALSELLERLAAKPNVEIHLYAQRVADLNVLSSGRSARNHAGSMTWHRIWSVPGPHVLRFFCWFFLNRFVRAWDSKVHGLRYDAVLSAGINCSDANVIVVHAVFHRLAELARSSPSGRLRRLHQRWYYRLLCFLERRLYTRPRVQLAAVSDHTAVQLSRYFGRSDVVVIPNGVDSTHFSSEQLLPLRKAARQRWGFHPDEVVLLLIGNDWRNKGLVALLEALVLCGEARARALVVGQEDSSPFLALAERLQIHKQVTFAPPEADVRIFYAAADILVAPSLEDSFNLPALEAMSCGLPVVVSANAGLSEWVHPGEDAVVLHDPSDAHELAGAILRLIAQPDTRRLLGENGSRTARKLSWDRHAEGVFALVNSFINRR